MTIEPKHFTIPRRVRYATLEPDGAPTEIWLGLHGYNQLAHRFLRYLQPLEGGTRLIVAPEGLHRQYVDHAARKVGASWMTSEDRLIDIADYVAYLDALHAHLIEERGLAAESLRTVALGFSQGVHTLCRWIAFGNARIDRAVLWGSTVPPDLDLTEHGETLSRADLQLVMGDSDEYFGAATIAAHEARLTEAGVRFTSHIYEGGHRLDAEVLKKLAE
ncbi:MAG: hypothetical protein MJB57_05200 [Gemmatimonadetes bacterium]|nr:hypothetical protein [Gemmatimonadota bacterium]